ncbi:uncharacterized protein LOC121383395 [Gigantopelta aegis]|uniref:uncharacterized protein LOC121383395 n=1 Tax=Gigantopelta aegis TaxID=1735272 RepID=UPI001B88E185|nr:uncharacterized protein LOC121383395 [Gigantopelta aegis]XP_041369333.1 uncharacterized protein LOC121383395 [Gigantopelta aegis]
MDSSFGRKSERPKKKKRSFSPDGEIGESSTQAVHKRRKKKHILPPAYGANRPYDRLSNGMPFCCDLCKSPYVCNPRMSKRGSRTNRSKHQPCPRIKTDSITGRKLTLCNACGLALDRPKHAKRTPKPTLTEEDKKKYLAEAKRFAATLAKDLKEPEVGDLYCPTIKRTPCKCLQRYILRGTTKEACGVNARLLVNLLMEARRLASLKSYDINQMTMTGKRGKKYRNIGLGNGQKRSKQFEHFVMTKRHYLRNELELCERATQKVLCYSNNFLHKKLKTEERGCRIERVRGKCALGQLIPLKVLYKHHCCIDNCVRMSLTHLLLLEQWRERAQTGQAEARRVLAEMLTPSGGIRQNCYKFISMVTGCSQSTVCKVNDQMKETGGEREPPIHGLRKYWLTCTLKGKMAPMDGSLSTTGHMEQPDTPTSTVSQSTDQSNQEAEVTSTTSCPDQATNCAELNTSSLNSEVQREKLLQLQQQLLQQQKNIQEQQRIVQAQLLQHTLVQQMTKSDDSPQASSEHLPRPDGSSGVLLQQLASPDDSHPRRLSDPDQCQQAHTRQMSTADQSPETAFQLNSTPDGSQPILQQQITKPAGLLNHPPSQTDGPRPALYELTPTQDGSQCVLLQQMVKPDGSQPFIMQQFPKEISPQQALPQIVSAQVAVPDTSKPDGSFQGFLQQFSSADPSHQQLLQSVPVSGGPHQVLFQQLTRSQQVPIAQMPKSNESVQFTLCGSQQVLPPQIQANPALYQQSPNTFQGVTSGHWTEKHHLATSQTISALHNIKQSDPHHVTRDRSGMAHGSGLQPAIAHQHTNISLQKPSQVQPQLSVPLRHVSPAGRTDRQTQSSSSNSNQPRESDGSQANIAAVPLMILHRGTQNQQIQFPIVSAPAVVVLENEKLAANIKNPTLSASEKDKTNLKNNSATPFLFRQSRNQGVRVVTPVIPESFQVHILPPSQVFKETQRSSVSLNSESEIGSKRTVMSTMLIQNMADNPCPPEIPGPPATPVSYATRDKPLIFNHPEPVQQNSLPFVAFNPASVSSSGARIQILSPVNLQQIQEMISQGKVQQNCSPSGVHDTNMLNSVVSHVQQQNQRQKRQIDDSSAVVHQSRNMVNTAAVKHPVGFALPGQSSNRLAISSSKPCTTSSVHHTDKVSQTEKMLPEIPSSGLYSSSHSTVPMTVISNQPKTSNAKPNRSQNAHNTFQTMAASNTNSADQKIPQQAQGNTSENINHPMLVEPTSFVHIDSKLGRQHLQYSLEPTINSPLFLQPTSPVMESLNNRQIQHFLSNDDLSRPISARTLDFDFSCSPLTVSDRDSILSRSRNSSGESIEPTISLDTSSLPRELLQLFIQQGIPFTISNGQQT